MEATATPQDVELIAEKVPVHSTLDGKILYWADEHHVRQLMVQGRATLVRQGRGKRAIRRVYLQVRPGDENDPRVWDLQSRMAGGRKDYVREIVQPANHLWTWNFRLKGKEAFVTLAAVLQEERSGLYSKWPKI